MRYNSRDVPEGAPGSRRDGGAPRKGSVKAARERLQLAQNNYLGISPTGGLPSKPNQLVSQFKAKPPDNATPPNSSGNQTADRITQWPLASQEEPDKKEPPRRPPRPSYVPSILDPTQRSAADQLAQRGQFMVQRPPNACSPQPPNETTQLQATTAGWTEEEFLSPRAYNAADDRPITLSSQSTYSSLGDIPDFPVPEQSQQAPKKTQNIGPPPTARRGPSSYYSQMSVVSPIREESEGTRSHISFASSNVFPPDQSQLYFDDGGKSPSDFGGVHEDGSFAKDIEIEKSDRQGLVRHASLGRRQKPSLTTIRSGDTLRDDPRRNDTRQVGVVGQAAVAAGAAGGAFAAGLGSRSGSKGNSRVTSPGGSRSNLSSGTGLLDDSSSDSDSLISPIQGVRSKDPLSRSRSPLATFPLGNNLNDLSNHDPNPFNIARQSSLADRAGSRRPPKLNIDAVRDAEARGSMTSLPDLIRRATRLAANLDRGQTASRLDMDFYTDANGKQHQRGSGSMSDMLASFPPPALGTPDRVSFYRGSKWPSPLALDQTSTVRNEEKSRPEKKGRRCCGMPLWLFIVAMIVLAIFITAAVVIPIVLIVLPRQREAAQNASVPAQCGAGFSCANEGVAIVTPDSSCSCLCKNGFTGERCETAADQSCTTISVSNADSATVGSAVPRLLCDANANFSIPLNSEQVLAQFSAADLNCRQENTLVTFNGLAQRTTSDHVSFRQTSFDVDHVLPPAPVKANEPRQDVVPPSSPTATPTTLLTDDSTPTSVPAPTETGAGTNTEDVDVATMRDFARVSVLFVLQESRSFDRAVDTQKALQEFFGSELTPSNSPTNLTVTQGFTVNLDEMLITVPNGTTFGRL